MLTRTDPKRAQIARIGGLALAASRDPHEYTAAGTAAFLRTFEDAVDPERELSEEERRRRADAARRLHFARLAYKRWHGGGSP